MPILPKELSAINNPDILHENLEKYKEYTIKLRDKTYNVYLLNDYDYVHKDGEFIASHNVDDDVIYKLKDMDYLSNDTDGDWNIFDIGEMIMQCDRCKSYSFDDKCSKCPAIIVVEFDINNLDQIQFPIMASYKSYSKTRMYLNNKPIMSFSIGIDYPKMWYCDKCDYSSIDLKKYYDDDDDNNHKILTITTDEPTSLIKEFYCDSEFVDEDEFQASNMSTYYYRYNHIGYCGDINGLTYFNGVYHMFYQHDPFVCEGENMFWGHITSTDLHNWTSHGIALRPYIDAIGQCFSGCGNVKDGKMFFMFTDTGVGETLAFYDDKKDLIKPDKVVLKHTGRDPKVIKYGNHWVMIVSHIEGTIKQFRFYISDDLYNWKHTCSIDNMYECPEFIHFPIGYQNIWVLFEASNKYMIGTFNGEIFTPFSNEKYQSHFGDFYASQCFTNCAENIQIGNIRFNTSKYNVPQNHLPNTRKYMRNKNILSSYNTFSVPLKLNLINHHGNNYELKIKFVINHKPEKYMGDYLNNKNNEITITGQYTIIKDYRHKGILIGDIPIDLGDKSESHIIEIIPDKHVLEVIVNNSKYYAFNVDIGQNGLKIKKID